MEESKKKFFGVLGVLVVFLSFILELKQFTKLKKPVY